MKVRTMIMALALSLTARADVVPVNTGSTANDGTGDTLRIAFGKLNGSVAYLTNAVAGVSAAVTAATNPVPGWITASTNPVPGWITAATNPVPGWITSATNPVPGWIYNRAVRVPLKTFVSTGSGYATSPSPVLWNDSIRFNSSGSSVTARWHDQWPDVGTFQLVTRWQVDSNLFPAVFVPKLGYNLFSNNWGRVLGPTVATLSLGFTSVSNILTATNTMTVPVCPAGGLRELYLIYNSNDNSTNAGNLHLLELTVIPQP